MYHTRALILKKDEWNEADWLVTVLSEDFGKIRLLAQGARKHGAKLQGHLESGTVAGISFVIGRNGYRLTTARLNAFPASARASLGKLRALAVMLELLDANLFEERDRAGELFGMLQEAMGALERISAPGSIRKLVMWFQVRLVAFLGLLPSPRSPEGREIKSLVAFAGRPATTIGTPGVSEERLERELLRLRHRLGGAVQSGRAVSGAFGAIY